MDFQSETSSDLGQDDMSCCSYSSGWERSSSSEYFDMTDNEFYPESDQDMSDQEPIANLWKQPSSTGATKIFDMEYTCELISLTNNKNKNNTVSNHENETGATNTNTMTITDNPWKKQPQTPSNTTVDPWAFLDAMNKPETKKMPVHNNRHTHNHNRQQSQQPRTTIDNSNTNKLCKYKNDCRMNKHNNCNMIHSLQEWKPRVCRFNKGCRRKNVCGYYHTDTPLHEYLRILINTEDTIYAKNAMLYQKYLQ